MLCLFLSCLGYWYHGIQYYYDDVNCILDFYGLCEFHSFFGTGFSFNNFTYVYANLITVAKLVQKLIMVMAS